jgi:hypothetical protein
MTVEDCIKICEENNRPVSHCPDGPRYKAIGNFWAVPVVRWIGRRIDRSR